MKPKRPRLTSNPLARIGQQAGYTTMQDRADALGITKSYLAHLERGAFMPSLELVARMAERYGRTTERVEHAARQGCDNLSKRSLEHSRGED